MKPYGIPRNLETEFPDKGDIKLYGFATPDRCSRADRGKQQARLMWKKIERQNAKRAIAEELKDLD